MHASLEEQILSLPEIVSLGCRSASLVFQGKRTKPDMFRLDFSDGRPPVAFKTYALKSFFVRSTAGWFVTRRENRFLSCLTEIRGICRVAYPPSRTGIFLEWIQGKPLHRFPQGDLPSTVFQELTELIKEMHAAGIVHLDIAHRGNIMITDDGKPVLIDFQSAVFIRNWPSWIQRLFIAIDELTVLKWRKKLFPDQLTRKEHKAYALRNRLRSLWPWSH